jgi:hypothetical protein
MKKNISKIAVALIAACTSSAYAATTSAAGDEAGPLVWSLIGFGVFVVMVQAIPALFILYSIIKGLATPAEKPVTPDKI